MEVLGWSDALMVGHQKIDADHRRLIDIITRLMQAANSGEAKEKCDLEFDDLIASTWEHFALEERLLQVHKHPDITQHQKEHAKLIDELILLKAHFDEGAIPLPENLQEVLHAWLTNHIQIWDKPLADFIRTSKPSRISG